MGIKTESFRGVKDCNSSAKQFTEAGFFDFYQRHKDELIIGVREGFINLYYNCYRFAKIEERKSGPLFGLINSNHFTAEKKEKGKEIRISAEELEESYDTLKSACDSHNVFKGSIALSRLFIKNNLSPSSEWFCIDIEHEKSLTDEKGKRTPSRWRFDIIAISKTNHIELQ